MSTEKRTITMRGIELREDQGDGTRIEGIAVPFGQRIGLWPGTAEEFAPDCDFGDTTRTKLSRDHGRLIGKITNATREADGLHITAAISDTAEGRDAVQLIRDGVVDSFSVGFQPVTTDKRVEGDTTVYVRRAVRLLEVAVTGIPAYTGAAITGQRDQEHVNQETNETKEKTVENEPTQESRFDQLEMQIRSLADTIDRQQPEPPHIIGGQYRSAGEYAKSLAAGEDTAYEFMREARDLISSTDVHNTNTWVADQIRLIQSRRSVATLFQHAALPATGMTLEYLKLGSNTLKVTQQATEGTTLATGKITLTSATAAVATYGGYAQLSRQVIERSNTPALDTALRALTIAYSNAVESAARAKLTAAITAATANKLDTPAAVSTLTADQWITVIINAAEAADARGAQLGTLAVSKDVFDAMAKITRSGDALMDVSGEGVDKLGSMSLTGVTGRMLSVPVRMVPGAAANTAAFIDPTALQMWEAGGPFQLQQDDTTKLLSNYSVYGYAAFATVFEGGNHAAGPKSVTPPPPVASRNLLAYGPASGSGLTATVNEDGSLHLAGDAPTANKGLRWRWECPDTAKGQTVIYSVAQFPAGTYSYLQARGTNLSLLATLETGKPSVIPEDTVTLELRIAASTTNPIDGDLRAQLELGATATDWTRPDNTGLEGGD